MEEIWIYELPRIATVDGCEFQVINLAELPKDYTLQIVLTLYEDVIDA